MLRLIYQGTNTIRHIDCVSEPYQMVNISEKKVSIFSSSENFCGCYLKNKKEFCSKLQKFFLFRALKSTKATKLAIQPQIRTNFDLI